MEVNKELYDRVRALPRRFEDRQLYFRWHELWWCLWNVLAYQHDNMECEAEAARRNAADCARLLREHSDALDGPEASDVRIAWAAEMARYTIYRELRYEHDMLQSQIVAGATTPRPTRDWREPRGTKLRHPLRPDEMSRCPIG